MDWNRRNRLRWTEIWGVVAALTFYGWTSNIFAAIFMFSLLSFLNALFAPPASTKSES